MTTRFNMLINFVEAMKAINETIARLDITGADISHLRALDPEFDNVATQLAAVLTATTETPTEEPEITPTPTETPTETPTTDAPTEEPEINGEFDGWKAHPELDNIELSINGEVRYNGNINISPKMISGYVKFYDPGTKKYWSLAQAMLTTFRGSMPRTYCPIYLDGDKNNCSLSNLEWGMRDSTLTTSQVERAAKLIAENPRLSENELMNVLASAGTVKSVGGLRSILNGNYSMITDRYFKVSLGGSIIPVETETPAEAPTEVPEEDIALEGSLRDIVGFVKNPQDIRELYKKLDHPTTDDLAVVILSFYADGYTTPADIQRAIRKEFGRALMVSNRTIADILR